MLGIGETAILIIVVIVIFGAKKLPELARSAGKSARILKSEVKAMKSDHPPSASGPRIINSADGATSSDGIGNGPTGRISH
ncbi:Sec-independent protein translocase subunit TatA [Streptomyces sp. DH37]|uniref:Sec-independent protein translocase subunit TatA n=1 Tax=Streptomyces sp. DH37 TaxID=3040122 RepID=UPI0024420B01|nr:Sec-independent protein translocase subunit TatA [Streptomyces sp. DH37]MDG9702887.1 Sec-independent protein translocase subunit TatA [Streptomyces sp. DH37]